MPGDKKKKDKAGKSDTAITDFSDAEYIHQQFPQLTHEQVKQAIKEAGPGREDIVQYIKAMELQG